MITTLIPAYKTTYFSELLLGLATQTFSNFKVIVSDDSPNNEITRLIKSPQLAGLVKHLNIEIIEGPKKGGYTNALNLVRQYSHNSEFFHILLDDDLIYPTFYETHIRKHHSKDALISVSARWTANPLGQPYKQAIDYETSRSLEHSFGAKKIGKLLLPKANNMLGEWSHGVFRKESSTKILKPEIGGISYFGIDDFGSYLNATQEQDGIYIPMPLGIFRMHPNQNTKNTHNPTIKCSHYSWIALAIGGVEHDWISQDEAMNAIKRIQNNIVAKYSQDSLGIKMLHVLNAHTEYNQHLKQDFLALWNGYLTEIKVQEILDGDLSIQLL